MSSSQEKLIKSLISVKHSEKVDEAVKYIIFLSDANELYNVALSMYDLSLVVLIAQHSQKVKQIIFLFHARLPRLNFMCGILSKKIRIQKSIYPFYKACENLKSTWGNLKLMIIWEIIDLLLNIYVQLLYKMILIWFWSTPKDTIYMNKLLKNFQLNPIKSW